MSHEPLLRLRRPAASRRRLFDVRRLRPVGLRGREGRTVRETETADELLAEHGEKIEELEESDDAVVRELARAIQDNARRGGQK